MSSVNITNVVVLDNPARWTTSLQFEITFECLTPLQEGARQSLIWVYAFWLGGWFNFFFLCGLACFGRQILNGR